MSSSLFRWNRGHVTAAQPRCRKRFRPALETLEDRCLLSGAGSQAAPQLAACGQIPLSFEANQGQTDSEVRFLSRGNGYALYLTENEAVLSLQPMPSRTGRGPRALAGSSLQVEDTAIAPGAVVRMQLVGANPGPQVTGLDKLAGASNYFRGNDPAQWHANVTNFSRVQYSDVYAGVDLVYYGNQRQLEYDFTVAPGADPGVIRLAFQGAEGMTLDEAGNLVLQTAGGDVVEQSPVLYQNFAGVRQPVRGRYKIEAGGEVGFEVGSYDASRPLVIDPVLSYLSYLGGMAEDEGDDVAVDNAGNVYLLGETQSTNFPQATAGAFQGGNKGGTGGLGSAGGDVFVLKLDPTSNTLLYATYLGGTGDDYGYTIAVDGDGNAYLGGETISDDFPTTVNLNPAQIGKVGDWLDAFVTKLNSTGSALVYSSYLGSQDGNAEDSVSAIAVDTAGQAYLTGFAGAGFPTTADAFQTALANPDGSYWDAFVAKVNAAGTALIYCTYLGGPGYLDSGQSIAVDSVGNAYVTGITDSSDSDFPTTPNAFQKTFGGGYYDAFVAKLNPSGSALIYSTYLGGAGDEDVIFIYNQGYLYFGGIAVDSSDNAYVTGFTSSEDFPTINAKQPTIGGYRDAFVTKLNSSGSALVYSTYLGGLGEDIGTAIAVDDTGSATLTGRTNSDDFPVLNAVQDALVSGTDAFVTQVNAAGPGLVYSTYLGGSGDDQGYSIALDGSGGTYVLGKTTSTDLHTVAAYQNANGGGADGFLVILVTPTSLAFSAAGYTVSETGGSATITVLRSGGSAGTATVSYAASGGTAQAGADYTATSGTLTFGPGDTSKTFTVSILDDRELEGPETVSLVLSSPTGSAILGTPVTATLAITDYEEGQFQFSAPTYGATENAGSVMVTVTRAKGSDGTVTVHYATSDGTATAGADYTAASLTLTFAAGETSKTFAVALFDDTAAEGNETINLALSGPTGGAVLGSPAKAVLTIRDNDTHPIARDDIYNLGSAKPTTSAANSVLSNDTGTTLSAVVVNTTAFGSLALNADGTFSYTPNGPFWGMDSFTYKANNGTVDSNIATVNLISYNALQVKKLYNQVLHRPPEPAGWEYWTRRVEGGTASLGTIASEIFESPERIDPIVTQMYHDYLLRSPDANGLGFWRGIWQHDGEPVNVIAGIVGSIEFFNSSGGTNRGWVTEMYRRLLNREPDPAGLDFWSNQLDSGKMDRFHVILGFVQSDENFHSLVRGWFQQYLGRTPTAQEDDLYFKQLKSGTTQRTVQIELLDTSEYLNTPPASPPGTAQRIG